MERLAAMLDTEANPCVIDSGTAKRTKLFEMMVPAPKDVYRFCNHILVLSYATAGIFLESGKLYKSGNSNFEIVGGYSIVVTLIYTETGFR